ncbi:MAG: hypothetical protein LAT82_04205 [Nanoarchaeota archaeon]|nr:hypothetical protein [Nanoarchaeota archaeon]
MTKRNLTMNFERIGNLNIPAFDFKGGNVEYSRFRDDFGIQRFTGNLYNVQYPGFFNSFQLKGFRKVINSKPIIMGIASPNFDFSVEESLDELDYLLNPTWLFGLNYEPQLRVITNTTIREKNSQLNKQILQGDVYRGTFFDIEPDLQQHILRGDENVSIASLLQKISIDNSLIRSLEKELEREKNNQFRIKIL